MQHDYAAHSPAPRSARGSFSESLLQGLVFLRDDTAELSKSLGSRARKALAGAWVYARRARTKHPATLAVAAVFTLFLMWAVVPFGAEEDPVVKAARIKVLTAHLCARELSSAPAGQCGYAIRHGQVTTHVCWYRSIGSREVVHMRHPILVGLSRDGPPTRTTRTVEFRADGDNEIHRYTGAEAECIMNVVGNAPFDHPGLARNHLPDS